MTAAQQKKTTMDGRLYVIEKEDGKKKPLWAANPAQARAYEARKITVRAATQRETVDMAVQYKGDIEDATKVKVSDE